MRKRSRTKPARTQASISNSTQPSNSTQALKSCSCKSEYTPEKPRLDPGLPCTNVPWMHGAAPPGPWAPAATSCRVGENADTACFTNAHSGRGKAPQLCAASETLAFYLVRRTLDDVSDRMLVTWFSNRWLEHVMLVFNHLIRLQ